MMAAYPYYGMNYGNPYGAYYPQGYQPVMQPQTVPNVPQVQSPVQTAPQSYSPAINQSGIIWISGMQEAQMYPVGPNAAVALWQKDGKTIYLKQADATGKPTMTVYDLVERKESASDTSAASGDKSPDYATKDDLSTIIGAVKGLAGEVEQMKGDLYGVAGRKKAVKKAEAMEDDA